MVFEIGLRFTKISFTVSLFCVVFISFLKISVFFLHPYLFILTDKKTRLNFHVPYLFCMSYSPSDGLLITFLKTIVFFPYILSYLYLNLYVTTKNTVLLWVWMLLYLTLWLKYVKTYKGTVPRRQPYTLHVHHSVNIANLTQYIWFVPQQLGHSRSRCWKNSARSWTVVLVLWNFATVCKTKKLNCQRIEQAVNKSAFGQLQCC